MQGVLAAVLQALIGASFLRILPLLQQEAIAGRGLG